MSRIGLIISYDGTRYVGWQMQPNGTAVEAVINQALSELLGEDIVIIGASRTDSGVHARGNVAVFDTETRIPADKICYALNQRLPEDIVVQDSFYVDDNFHPRHADCTKTYEYTIYNANHPDPILRRYSYFVYVPLDVEAMKEAASYLVGEHDFASFCSAHAQQLTTVRTIYGIDITVEPVKEAYDRLCGENSSSGEATEKELSSSGVTTEKELSSSGEATEKELSSSGVTTEKELSSSGEATEKELSSSGVTTEKELSSGAETTENGLSSGSVSTRKKGAGIVKIRIWGNGFLYNMVRIIVGTLVRVGHHMYTPEHVKEILEACDRNVAGPKAPAEGLTLLGIEYGDIKRRME